VTSDPVEGEDGDGSDSDDYCEEHDGDEPGGSVGCFWRGLGDAKGINEDIREIEERLHSFLIKLHLQRRGCIYF
jgi:hypothetical protein